MERLRGLLNMGGAADGLDACLAKVANLQFADIPKEVLDRVCEASSELEDRRKIMQHIYKGLGATGVANWRQVYAALMLFETLINRGSPKVIEESRDGHHFDVIQKLTMLTVYENESDRRVERLIREKAQDLRKRFLNLQCAAPEGELSSGSESRQKSPTAASPSAAVPAPGSPQKNSTNEISGGGGYAGTKAAGAAEKAAAEKAAGVPLASTPALRSPDTTNAHPARAQAVVVSVQGNGRTVLGGVAKVGHSDDTSDEESEDEEEKKRDRDRSRRGRDQDRAGQNPQEGGWDSSTQHAKNPQTEDKVVAVAATGGRTDGESCVDLLGFEEELVKKPVEVPVPRFPEPVKVKEATPMDLFDFDDGVKEFAKPAPQVQEQKNVTDLLDLM